MILIDDKTLCCGCTACKSICPQDAITMVKDGLGFEYPYVDPLRCIDCGLCDQVCTFSAPAKHPEGTPLAARHKEAEELAASQSGGAFAAISDAVLEQGGIVCGAAFNDDFSVSHRLARSKEERDAFRGSKYVQSSMGGCISEIRDELDNGRTVLFSGTPCQVNGLISVTGERDNLITVDIICHGVPAPKVWEEYLSLAEKEAGSPVSEASFRDKGRFGWHIHRETFTFADGVTADSRSYADLFYKHLMLRPSCSACTFNSTSRISDITIGDLWGWQEAAPEMNPDDKGLSLVLLNTEKGRKLWEKCSARMDCKEVDIAKCLQRPLSERVDISPLAEGFEKDFQSTGIEYVLKKYGDRNLQSRMNYLYKDVRKTARKIILGK